MLFGNTSSMGCTIDSCGSCVWVGIRVVCYSRECSKCSILECGRLGLRAVLQFSLGWGLVIVG